MPEVVTPQAASPSTWHLDPEVYLLPTSGSGTMVYAPRRGLLLEVDTATNEWLATLHDGGSSAPPFLAQTADELARIGILRRQGAMDRRLERATQRGFHPTHVTLFVTGRCNLRCVYCYSHGGEAPDPISLPMARTALAFVIDNAKKSNVDTCAVSFHGGGEPTTEPALLRAIVDEGEALARSAGLKLRFSLGTNGVMPVETAQWVTEKLHGATVSLDGTARVQNTQRPRLGGGDSYDALVRTLALFDERRFNYSLRMTVTESTVGTLPSLVEHAISVSQCRTIMAEPVFIVGRALELAVSPPSEDDFVEAFIAAQRIAERNERRLVYSGLRPQLTTTRFCQAAGRSFCVTPDGHVSSCYEITSPQDERAARFFFGRVHLDPPRVEIDERRLDWLASQTVENLSECADCFVKWHCAGDCLAKASLTRGEDRRNLRRSPRCHINRALTRHHLETVLREGRDVREALPSNFSQEPIELCRGFDLEDPG